MYPNYFFSGQNQKPVASSNALPGVIEEVQYGETRADTTGHSNTNNNNSKPSPSGMLDFTTTTPPIQDDILYTQGYLRTQIGKYVKIDFLIGTNLFIDKEGILRKVGISYVVIEESGTGDMVMCDMYSIKFVATSKKENAAMNTMPTF